LRKIFSSIDTKEICREHATTTCDYFIIFFSMLDRHKEMHSSISVGTFCALIQLFTHIIH